jgi:tetratricopeptide (TPR) repeat protein
MSSLEKYKNDFALLLEAGFIAASLADEDAALKLFRASNLLQPNNTMPKVGFGYVHLLKLELKQACDQFNSVLSTEPDNQMARALLGLSMGLNQKEANEGEKHLQEALKKSSDPQVKNMASTAIEFIERFVKKTPTPVQGQAPQTPPKKKGKPKGPDGG